MKVKIRTIEYLLGVCVVVPMCCAAFFSLFSGVAECTWIATQYRCIPTASQIVSKWLAVPGFWCSVSVSKGQFVKQSHAVSYWCMATRMHEYSLRKAKSRFDDRLVIFPVPSSLVLSWPPVWEFRDTKEMTFLDYMNRICVLVVQSPSEIVRYV